MPSPEAVNVHVHFHSDPAMVTLLTSINRKLTEISNKEDAMATQADIDALSDRLGTAVSAIQQEIADIQQANPSLDLSGLTDKVAAVEALEMPAASDAPPAAPADSGTAPPADSSSTDTGPSF